MRWIFLLLLIGNLLLFVLIYQSGNGQDVLQGNPPVGQLDVMPLGEYEQGEKGFGQDEVQQAAGVNSREQTCSTLGPLTSRAQAAELSAELARLGVPSRVRSETLTSVTDYWVIQTPGVTADNQQSDIARLRRAGITDISPIDEGEHSGGISLGIYSDRTDAIKRRQQVDRFGLTAEIVERGDAYSVYWVDTRRKVDSVLDDGQTAALQKRFIAISIEDVDCP